MATTQAVQYMERVHAALANDALPTEEQLKQAYRELMIANGEHTKRGLAFGLMCYQLQQAYKKQGKAGEGFKARLEELDISKRTAYRWITKYKERELNATRHKVRKGRKETASSEGQNVQLEFDLPANYPRAQWDADVKTLGGRQKVRKMFIDNFLPEVRERAEATRKAKHRSSGSVQ